MTDEMKQSENNAPVEIVASQEGEPGMSQASSTPATFLEVPDVIDLTCDVADFICTDVDEVYTATGNGETHYLDRAKLLGLSSSDLFGPDDDEKVGTADEVADFVSTTEPQLIHLTNESHQRMSAMKSLSPISMRLRLRHVPRRPDVVVSEEIKTAAPVKSDTLPPKKWFNDEAEREVFAIFLCVALNIDRPAEFTSEMHPKTMIDKAVWIRPPCPIERLQNVAMDYVMSKIPGLYDLDMPSVELHRAVAHDFRDFLRRMINFDKVAHSSDPEVILRCKGRGCINDKFQQNNSSGASLPCADCVHTELEKMIDSTYGKFNEGLIGGNGCCRELKSILESEIRGDNLSFGEIQRNTLRAERNAAVQSQKQPYVGPTVDIVDMPVSIPAARPRTMSQTSSTPVMRESILQSEEESDSHGKSFDFESEGKAPPVKLQTSSAPQLESTLKHAAAALGQLLPAPAKKVTIAITYES